MRGLISRLSVALLVAVVGLAVVVPAASGQSEDPGTTAGSDASANPRATAQGGTGPNGVTPQEGVTAQAAVGGPVIIMGIDAEDGGVGSHGPISVYDGIVSNLSTLTKNGGAGILVLGGGKSPTDDVTEFWNQIATDTGIPVTYSNGAAVATQSFAGFQMVAVVSGDGETSSGGLDATECNALAARQQDFFNHVGSGGGLLVFAQDVSSGGGCEYAFFGGFGAFTFTTGGSYNDILPTAAGTAVGISDALDVIAWHDNYQTFPDFLQVLALVDEPGELFGQVAAIGGASVVFPTAVEVVPTFTG